MKRLPELEAMIKPYRVQKGNRFRLKDYDPGDTQDLHLKEKAEDFLKKGVEELDSLQQMLFAQDRWALLLIFQGMDASGKDGVIRHVMSGINPQGCQVYSFKAPSNEDLSHDYLWRISKCLPERGRIGIFNRSYYEEVLVVRAHPALLEKERLPPSRVTSHIWKERLEDIKCFEQYLDGNGIVIRKFFLHLSKEEQRRRFLARLDEPRKNWKISPEDVEERQRWDDYMHAYEEMIQKTSTKAAPWYIVPADHKWFARLMVASIVIHSLRELRLSFPKVDSARRKQLDIIHKKLTTEGD